MGFATLFDASTTVFSRPHYAGGVLAPYMWVRGDDDGDGKGDGGADDDADGDYS